MLLPLSGARWLGKTLGAFVFDVLGYRKEVTLGNLRRAFPEKSEDERVRIARGSFRNVGISLFELLWFPRLTRERVLSLLHFDKPEIMSRASEKGKGLLLLTAHFGNWELLALSISVRFGIQSHAIAKTQSNRLVNRSINKRRTQFGNKLIPMETSLRQVLKALRDNEIVGLVADQAAPKENVPLDFFGTLVPTHQGPSVFSLKMNSPLISMFSVRRDDGSYDMFIQEVPSDDLDGYTEENATELTRRHLKITEDIIRRFPDQWMWMHNRWKHVAPSSDHVQTQQ